MYTIFKNIRNCFEKLFETNFYKYKIYSKHTYTNVFDIFLVNRL